MVERGSEINNRLDEWNFAFALKDGRSVKAIDGSLNVSDGVKRYHFNFNNCNLTFNEHSSAYLEYIRFLLKTKALPTAHNAFQYTTPAIISEIFKNAESQNIIIPYKLFSAEQERLGVRNRWQLHYLRHFYRWGFNQGYSCFCQDVLTRVEKMVIGGNKKGRAVKTEDPEQGPLTDAEVRDITLSLRASFIEDTISLGEQVAVWLCLAFGSNASQYAMMRESDVDFIRDDDGDLVATIIKVPRHKKRHSKKRSEFKPRKLNRFVSTVVQKMIEQNENRVIDASAGEKRPLFWSDKRQDQGPNMAAWSWHITANQFTNLVKKAITGLNVRSRTGGDLQVTSRRFRYTLATRLLQEGASSYAVASALDHSDLQNVQTYTHLSSQILDHINPAVAKELGDRAKAFTQIIASEDQAVNGDVMSSRRYFGDREANVFEPIGTCGHNTLCNVAAPLACYVCPRFQPWLDAPHQLVLDSLISRRNDRRERSSDMRMVGLEDEILAAVANVVNRIETIKASS